MNEDPPFERPTITDDDICWASSILGLGKDAFRGANGCDPRQNILKCMETVDVAACPGSGKTTLLVAKLAILARRWSCRTRGICVLSHTNVARHEIERRLGNTDVGQRLLAYPHFVGTIHSFVGSFFAVPWLRSQDYPTRVIDSDICETRRWHRLDSKWRSAMERKRVDKSQVRVADANFTLKKKNGVFPFADSTDTYKEFRSVCQQMAREGYHCYEDMFVWATDLIEKFPTIVSITRERFPLLFIDEAQDNSEEQSSMLHRLFTKGDTTVICQRFGDENQAIYDSIEADEATTRRFPAGSVQTLPNSHRFGEVTARLADPLGIRPHGLKGQGPKKALASGETEGRHTIFLFDLNCVGAVLDAYADLLIDTFSDRELQEGSFIAVAQRHRPPKSIEPEKSPYCIRDYWDNYDPELANRDPKPSTLVQYILAGMRKAEAVRESYPAVEKIGEGLLRLASMTQTPRVISCHRDYHQHILQTLGETNCAQRCYALLVSTFAARGRPLTQEGWETRWRQLAQYTAEVLAGGRLSSVEAQEFLSWKSQDSPSAHSLHVGKANDNVRRYSRDGKTVAIEVGSIHSVKGETHTAVLVLETYWKRHNMERLLPWLDGTTSGGQNQGPELQTRLRIHYVAMTRPTHLLCLAIKRSTFYADGPSSAVETISRFETRGWHISDLTTRDSKED